VPESLKVAFVLDDTELTDLASAAGLPVEAVSRVVRGQGEEAVEDLQDVIFGNSVSLVLLPTLERLAEDLMTQETILASWAERGIKVYSKAEPDLGSGDPARQLIRSVVGEIDSYGHIPWVP
jgi:hypothetical protein